MIYSGEHCIGEFFSCPKKNLNNKKKIENLLITGIKKFGLTLIGIHTHQFKPFGLTSIAIIGESHIAIHTYPENGRASIDIYTCSEKSEIPLKLLQFFKCKLKPQSVKKILVCRGNRLQVKNGDWVADSSCPDFTVKYKVKKKLFSKKSKHQQIDIIENNAFGRMLFLDNDLQIAERGFANYNKALISPLIKAKNKLSKILILGGGDGALAAELLKHNPKKVTIVDIDEEVINASKKILQKINKNCFNDQRVKIIIDDACRFLEKEHSFDAIICDLTMHPEIFSKKKRGAYFHEIFSNINKKLTANGMITMQLCAENDINTFKIISKLLSKYFAGIQFTKQFIPAYLQNWVFVSAKQTEKNI
ncbi:MAG: adenosylmethionine decarboxylase [Candidatus ainarchaeum sp.]|nr:adenosylmethionine decarboxylase [Candidatus ainarchaeum sp.]